MILQKLVKKLKKLFTFTSNLCKINMKKEDCLLQKEFKMLKEVLIKERDAITKMIEETDSQYDEILVLFSKSKTNCLPYL